jgi:RNA polymerase sigma-70 factor (ECF subfamily)
MSTDHAATQLLRSYAPALRRLAASYELDSALREDLLQEMLFALFRALPTWRRECSERTFVYRVALNRAMSHLASRRAPFEAFDHAAEVADPAPLPEDRLEVSQRHEQLLVALRRLPLGQRQLVTLALEGLSTRELAEVLGITENNVGVRLTRARATLRELLVPGSAP